jgi:UDP-2,3-diacylglucosamine hydrolase
VSNTSAITSIGLIAGNGLLPLEVAKAIKQKNIPVFSVSHRYETSPELLNQVKENITVRVGQLGKILYYFKKRNVSHVVFAGGIKRVGLSSVMYLDWKAIRLLSTLSSKHDDSLLRAVAQEFEKKYGFTVLSPHFFLPELILKSGFLTQCVPNAQQQTDIEVGWKVAKTLGLLDVGQTVVVSEGVVVALEGIDGTDETIRRAGKLCSGKPLTVVKLSKPNQDLRLDMPTIGYATIMVMNEANATCLALEADCTAMLEPQKTLLFADDSGICIVSKK